ncbi:MAG: PatB family C-S lyase [Chloroflexi bacterium]|nr:PatB family C-S lyase [Chloroflexota bacterium]
MQKQTVKCPDRRGTDSIKWGVYEEDVLPLWVADMDFTSPLPVIEALRSRVDHGIFGYPQEPPLLKELVIERMKKRYGWIITPKDILLVPGVVPGFNLVCQAATKPGGSMILQTPVYPPFLYAPANAGVRGIHCELLQQTDGSFVYDLEAFESAIEVDTSCFLFCNPHNPVGKVFTREELMKIAQICLQHHMIICSDEIHSDLIFSGSEHIPIASLSEEISDSTVTLLAPSKTFNIAGLECSVLICTNPELMKKVKKARRGLIGGVNLMGLSAGVAAYREGEPWLEEMITLLEENRDFLFDFLKKRIPQIKMHKPDATYLAWLDCRDLALEEGPYQFFLKNAKVALNNGEDFGKGGEGYVRLNFGCPRTTLEEALVRMEKAVKER